MISFEMSNYHILDTMNAAGKRMQDSKPKPGKTDKVHFIYNFETNKLIFSSNWKKLSGYEKQAYDLNNSTSALVLKQDGLKNCLAIKNEIINKYIEEFDFNIEIQHKDGFWLPVKVECCSLTEEDYNSNNIVGLIIADDIKRKNKNDIMIRNDRQRLATLIILNDLNHATKQLKVEIEEHRKSEQKLMESHEQLRLISQHLQDTSEKLNVYLAREIHDDLGQELTVLEMGLTLYEESLRVKGAIEEEDRSFLKNIRRTLDRIIKKTRRLTAELRPQVLDACSLNEALQLYFFDYQEQTGINLEVNMEEEQIDLDKKRNLAIYRIFQEALTNIVKHSQAENIKIIIQKKGDDVFFSIEDDGIGFVIHEARAENTYGLMNMKERAIFCGGDLKIESWLKKGTRIDLVVPFEYKL